MFGWLLRILALRLLARPTLRLCVGLAAVPAFRFIRRRCFQLHEVNAHLEKDIELWFRGSVVLLAATANMEHFLFGWVPLDLQGEYAWLVVGLRLLLAISVVELMPDQDVFALLHPGPPRFDQLIAMGWREIGRKHRELLHGLWCLHLRRSSPVLAIMAAIFGGPPGSDHHFIGWVCYGVAITQFLLIGIMTNRDRALESLPQITRRLEEARQEALEELELEPGDLSALEEAARGKEGRPLAPMKSSTQPDA